MNNVKRFRDTFAKVWLLILAAFSRHGKRKRKPQKKARVYRHNTISDTLETLDSSFRLLRQRECKFSWTDKKTRALLKTMGPYVPPPDYEVALDKIVKPDSMSWPGLIFVATNFSWWYEKKGESLDCVTSHMYAVKIDRQHPDVEFTKDMVYEIGMCGTVKNESIWCCTYIAIDRKDRLRLLRYKKPETVKLPNGDWFVRHLWVTQPLFTDEDTPDGKTRDSITIEALRMAFNFWFMRHKMWHVIVEKRGQRMNFCVDIKDTKHYFKDRNKKGICLETGKRRPIIHYVRPFERTLRTGKRVLVRPHIRGIRQFRWRGYNCNVKAPVFGGRTSVDWEKGMYEYADDESVPDNMVDTKRLGGAIALIEGRVQQNAYSEYTGPGSGKFWDETERGQ